MPRPRQQEYLLLAEKPGYVELPRNLLAGGAFRRKERSCRAGIDPKDIVSLSPPRRRNLQPIGPDALPCEMPSLADERAGEQAKRSRKRSTRGAVSTARRDFGTLGYTRFPNCLGQENEPELYEKTSSSSCWRTIFSTVLTGKFVTEKALAAVPAGSTFPATATGRRFSTRGSRQANCLSCSSAARSFPRRNCGGAEASRAFGFRRRCHGRYGSNAGGVGGGNVVPGLVTRRPAPRSA
jgi:hypothetical protein